MTLVRTVSSLNAGLFDPQSIAIIGASDDSARPTGRPLAFLRRAGWGGRIYPINPKREAVQGEKAWPTLDVLPEVPDHALILLPTEGVGEAVAACACAGVKVASILAGGFVEQAQSGSLRDIVAAARKGGTRILGPSSIGYADPRKGLLLTANAAFADPAIKSGRWFAASHSGSVIGALVSRGTAKGVGFAGLVSVGMEADLSLGEICRATLDDPEIDGYVLFLESLRHADALRAFALAAAAQGKPVVAYKLGQSAQAAELAQSHTGAMAGEDAVADAFFRACGIVRTKTLDGLLEAPVLAKSLRARSLRANPSVGVVTTTGGGAAMAVDQLGLRDISVSPPSAATRARLAEAGITTDESRILDLTMAGTRYETMKRALDVMTVAPEFDLVLTVLGSSSRSNPRDAVRPIIDSLSADKPIAVFATPEAGEALALLAEWGVPAFRTPESCADAIAACFNRRTPKPFEGESTATGTAAFLDEAESYALLKARGIPVAPFEVVALKDVPTSAPKFPVAAKLVSRHLQHKTEAGGVILNIGDQAELQAAAATLERNAKKHALTIDRILVQQMARGLGEVLVGFRRDVDAGPVVLLAMGGVLAELSRERALRLAPVTQDEAREMIAEITPFDAFRGYRNRPAADLEALARIIVAMSELACEPTVLEAELNPLILAQEGAFAVDALVRVVEQP